MEEFYLIERIYHYNSLESGIGDFTIFCFQIPEFEIRDLHLLNDIDFKVIDENKIPILRRVIESNTEYWKIDLTYYENFKL